MTKDTPSQAYSSIAVGRELRLQRQASSLLSLSGALLNIAQIISHELSVPPLKFAGLSARPINLDKHSLDQWLENFHEEYRRCEISQAYCLSSHRRKPDITLWLTADLTNMQIEEIFFSEPEKFPLDSLITTISQCYLEFGAFYGYVWDSLLVQLHGRNIRSHEIALAKTPQEDHKFLPPPLPIEGVQDTLPPLLLRWEFDHTCVPDGIWWINIWSKAQVEAIGLDCIRTANWFRLIERSDQSLLLITTEEPTDVRNFKHLEKIGSIVTHLQLREAQERFRKN